MCLSPACFKILIFISRKEKNPILIGRKITNICLEIEWHGKMDAVV